MFGVWIAKQRVSRLLREMREQQEIVKRAKLQELKGGCRFVGERLRTRFSREPCGHEGRLLNRSQHPDT